jgi:hypothetical protein
MLPGFSLSAQWCRQRKSLATTYSPTAVCRSTIGAGGLNFRVRNGNGWVPAAMVTRLKNTTLERMVRPYGGLV